MRVAILGSRSGWHERRLAEALEARGVQPLVAPVTALHARVGDGPGLVAADVALDACQAVVVRAIPPGSLEQVVFRVDALHRLARLGVAVVNPPRCIERSVDKYFTSALVEDAGLPTPRTRVCERFADALEAFAALGGDVVVKPLFGSEGHGILRVSDPDLAYRTFRALELARSVFYLQEYVEHGGHDIRVLVVGGRAVAAMRRVSPGWKTNVAQGARVEALEVTDRLAGLAVRAASVVEAEYAGVDLLPAPDGRLLVSEVNGIPGWRGLQATTALDVAALVADQVLVAGRRNGAQGRPRPGPLAAPSPSALAEGRSARPG